MTAFAALVAEWKRRFPAIPTKSGLMVGCGETDDEILAAMRDMRAHDIDMLTLGQYLQPTAGDLPVLALCASGRVRGVRAGSVCAGLPARGGGRAGALVVPRGQAGGRGHRRLAPPRSPGAASRIWRTFGTGGPAFLGHRIHIRPSVSASRLSAGVVAEAPEEVAAHGAANRAAGVLRHHEPLTTAPRQRIRRCQEHGRAENRARVDRQRALAQERHAESSDGARRSGLKVWWVSRPPPHGVESAT